MHGNCGNSLFGMNQHGTLRLISGGKTRFHAIFVGPEEDPRNGSQMLASQIT
jgi:hypothetical protein